MSPPRADVLVVSLGSTGGWRTADAALVEGLEAAGARVAVARTEPPREVRTFALTDWVWARAARRAAVEGIAAHRPRAVLYSSMTAALLWPRPGAVRFDALPAANRPGRHGLWQPPLARRRLAQATLRVPWSAGAFEGVPDPDPRRTVVVPVPVARAAAPPPAWEERDIAAMTYAADPHKRGLDRVLEAWEQVRRPGETLAVAGTGAPLERPGVEARPMLAYDEYRTLLRRVRVYVNASRREDYGIAPLEALEEGCVLVSTEAPGPYAALPIARDLDPRLVGDDLAVALRTALDDPAPGYAGHAAAALAPYRPGAVQRTIAEELLPALLRGV